MANDRISDRARWQTCVHEAGHVAVALLTGTPVIRAAAYRHYSTTSRNAGLHGYMQYDPPNSPIWSPLIEAAGIAAERLLTDASPRNIVRCSDRLPEDDESLDLCFYMVKENNAGVLRVAEVIREAKGRVPGLVLAQAFGTN